MATKIVNRQRELSLRVGIFDIVLFVQMFLLCLFYSQSYNFFEQYRSILFQSIFAIDVAFIIVALPLTPIVAMSSGFIIAVVMFYQAVFSWNYGTAFSGAYVGALSGLYAAGLFAVHAYQRTLSRALIILYLASVLYLFIFLYLRYSIDPNTIMKQQIAGGADVSKAILRAHGSEVASSGQTSYRIKTSGFHLAYALFYPVAMLRQRQDVIQRFGWFVAALFATYCLLVSDFRFNLACAIAALAIGLAPFISPAGKAKVTLFISFMSITLISLLSIAGVNIFLLFNGDESGVFRVNEFNSALPQIQSFPIFGIGLPGQAEDYKIPFPANPVYPSDLGYFGEFLQHGFVGMGLLFWCYYIIYTLVVRLYRRESNVPEVQVLLDCLVYTALSGFVITNLWEGGCAILISLAIAYLPILRRTPVEADS